MNKNLLFKICGAKKMYAMALFAALLLIPLNSGASTKSPDTVYASLAETPKISLRHSAQSLSQILRDIQRQCGVGFTISEEVQNAIGPVSIDVSDVTLDQALTTLLHTRGYTYRIVNNLIVIERVTVAQQPQKPKITVSGTVRDAETLRPIVGATVTVGKTDNGIATNEEGAFMLTFDKGEKLLISYVGKISEERVFEESVQNAVFSLLTDVLSINAVVVTGIFERPRESYTGAVTTINAQELVSYRGQNLLQTLRNIDPSINILANNLVGSNPNVLPELTIRGSSSLPLNVRDVNRGIRHNLNTPLIIMDGFEISLQKLMDYNDDEILSINILKDASATAIYGSRGANGVIVITSKQTMAGKLRINAKINIDLEIPDLSSYNLMHAYEKLKLEWDNGFYIDTSNPDRDRQLKEEYYRRLRDVIEGTDTDWLAKPLRTGINKRFNLRVEGGSKEFSWSVVVGHNRIEGVMKNSSRDNFSGQISLQYQYKNIAIKNQTEIGINKGVESNYGYFSNYVAMNPYCKVFEENGRLVKNYTTLTGGIGLGNPLYDATLNSKDESAYMQIINNFSIELKITEGLTLRGKFGISKETSRSDYFKPPKHSSYFSSNTDALEQGRYVYRPGESCSFDGSINIGYVKTINEKHQIYAGFDYSMLQRQSATYTIVGIGYINDKLNSLGNAMRYENGKPGESEQFIRSIGFTGNINYTYDSRYYADASFRFDGGSQFGSKNKFAPFWSIGLGWNLHRESFLKNSEIIDNFRLKISVGQTGSLQFDAYQALRTFLIFPNNRYGAWGAAYLSGLGNENLKWQITDQVNMGTELELFKNRWRAALDVYVKKTSNLLSHIDIPHATGFSNYIANVGEVKNIGFEASLGTYLIRGTEKGVSLSMNGKLAYNKNEITKLSKEIKRQNELYLKENVDSSTLFYEGRSQNARYAVHSKGIDPSTGKEIFIDKEGNEVYVWKASDKVYVGENQPTFRGNMSTMFRYGDFSLNLSFAYHWGGVLYNSTLLNKVEMLRLSIPRQNLDRRVYTERWSKPGDIARYKKIPTAKELDQETRETTRFIMKDRVFQFQTASAEYRIETDWLSRTGIQSARFGFNMSDIFYLSSVKRERGTNYPFARRMGVSLSLIF